MQWHYIVIQNQATFPAIHSNLELQDNMKERIFQVQTKYCSNNYNEIFQRNML